jgi:hypothetical protein
LGNSQGTTLVEVAVSTLGNQRDATLVEVAFHKKKEIDPDPPPEFNLVAEEVEKGNPDLRIRDSDGKLYTVRYAA